MNRKVFKKTASLLLVLLMFASAFYLVPAMGFLSDQSSAGADYIIVEGVAASDYYDSRQYSYKVNRWANETISGYGNVDPGDNYFVAGKSLRLGFTEYGEFATPDNVGIAYGSGPSEWANTESWASTEVDSKYWIQGWLLFVNYTRAGERRALMAYALYSDMNTAEAGRKVYSWFSDHAPSSSAAQLTEGSLITGGIKVLYDSARLVVFRTTITIHDGYYDEDFAKITFTVVYNKDTKYAIVYKDLKFLLDPKVLDEIRKLVFSQRFELDLARKINPSNWAYIHYFHNYNDTVYQHPLTGEKKYDALQAFDPDRRYIFFAGFWPNATEYSVYHTLVPDVPNNKLQLLEASDIAADIPSPSPGEPSTPWVIVQWNYTSTDWPNMLKWLAKEGTKREIRFVEVIGMTDYNASTLNKPYPALDKDAGDAKDQLDAEVWYLLNQVFNPEDLTTINNDPFMWIGLGQSAATTDSAGAGLLPDIAQMYLQEPFMLFDRNDSMFPWTSPVVTMKGTIPYGLSEFGGNYYEAFSNSGKGTGTDTTTYKRTALKGFAFGVYDDVTKSPPQPIAGGFSASNYYWYPSIDPLTERWKLTGSTWSTAMYDHIDYDPNGILSLGGMKANGLTRYFNDFYYSISREGTDYYALINSGGTTGSAPTSDPDKATLDFFPISTWASSKDTFGYKEGYAVIALARDINGTRGLVIYGWDGRDTFWAAAWASQYLGEFNSWIPSGTVALVLKITYEDVNREPTGFTIIKALGTITEFGDNDFAASTEYGFDKNVRWTGSFTPPSLPAETDWPYLRVWWYEKLATTSEAEVQFDA